MKVLFVSNLFPSCHEPTRGVFNLPLMLGISEFAELRVVAPIAWFPIKWKYGTKLRVPDQEVISGLTVYHPRNFYFPKIGRSLNPQLFAWSLSPLIKRIHQEFPFDIIHVDWTYPDGCGVAKIARQLRVPFVVSVAGSDVNLYIKWFIRRHQILRMMEAASTVITRSLALRNVLIERGLAPEKIKAIYNGVDCETYRPFPREDTRRELGIPPTESTIVYVGRLSPEKGIADLLTSLPILANKHNLKVRLLVVGGGPLRSQLEAEAQKLGVASQVQWLGTKLPAEVARIVSAADLLCLASLREGVPNVLMEAMACGTPVVATKVGGIPEVVPEFAGILVEPANPGLLADGIATALRRTWSGTDLRAHALQFTWRECARQFYEVFQQATTGKIATKPVPTNPRAA